MVHNNSCIGVDFTTAHAVVSINIILNISDQTESLVIITENSRSVTHLEILPLGGGLNQLEPPGLITSCTALLCLNSFFRELLGLVVEPLNQR